MTLREKYFHDSRTEDNVLTLIYELIDFLDNELYQELEELNYNIEELKGISSVPLFLF